MNRDDRPGPRRYAGLLAATAAVAWTFACSGNGTPAPAPSTARQAEVAERGRSVMPFDLDRTTHQFAKTNTGGVQTVTADDPADTTEVALVQQHLQQEAERFRRGDFTDPARIHGSDMLGLAALRGSAGKISVDYAATANGAHITYTTGDSALVTALHSWFDAQVSDHGAHATHG